MKYYQRNLLVLSTTIFLAAVSWNQVLPFLPLFLKSLGVKNNELVQWSGVVFAAQAAASIIAMPFWGRIGDKYGRKPMILRAGICLSAIYFGMSFCQSPIQLVIFRFLNGALTGFIPGSFALIATNTPQDEVPRAIATAQTVSAAGQIIGPVIGGALAIFAGYRGSMRVSGCAVLVSTLMVLIFVKEPNKVKQSDNNSFINDFRFAFKSPVLASIMLAVMLQGLFIMSVNPFLVVHLSHLNGHSPDWFKGLIFALPAAALFLSAHLWTMFGKKHKYNFTILLGISGACICALLLGFTTNIWMFSVLYFISGVFLAAIQAASSAIICNKIEEAYRGRAFGMQLSAGVLGAFIAPLAGSYIGARFGLWSLFIFVAFIFFLGALAFRILIAKKNAS